MSNQTSGSVVMPCLRYRDARGMIEWLGATFGFHPRVMYADEQGRVEHAELTLGTGMIMVGSDDGSRRDTPYGRLLQQPADSNGLVTQTSYLVLNDVDAVYARVKARGGVIITEPEDKPYGSREFICRDPEGHVWSVGTYNPWTVKDE